MKHALIPVLAMLAACSSTTTGSYDIQAFEAALAASPVVDRATASMDSRISISPSESLPSGFVSLFEQQADGTWVLKPDSAVAP